MDARVKPSGRAAARSQEAQCSAGKGELTWLGAQQVIAATSGCVGRVAGENAPSSFCSAARRNDEACLDKILGGVGWRFYIIVTRLANCWGQLAAAVGQVLCLQDNLVGITRRQASAMKILVLSRAVDARRWDGQQGRSSREGGVDVVLLGGRPRSGTGKERWASGGCKSLRWQEFAGVVSISAG
jgi:hypothetical protein